MSAWLLTLALGAQCSDNGVGLLGADDPLLDEALEVDPVRLDFGLLDPGQEATATFRITSTGTATARIDDLVVDGADAFTLTWSGPGTDLPPGASTEVVVTYRPASVADAAWVFIESSAEAQPVELLGAGAWPALAFDPPSVDLQTMEDVPVTAEVQVLNVGNAPLEVDGLVVQAEGFALEVELPFTLDPGAGQPVAVTFTPPGPDALVDGTAWFAANTPTGSHALPLHGEVVPECVGLAEAVTRGWVELGATSSPLGSSIRVRNVGEVDVCHDRWSIVLSDTTQDATIGDPLGDTPASYPLGSIRIAPGDEQFFRYAYTSVPAWWCVEQTQVTAGADDLVFTGAQVPEVLRQLVLAADQDGIWNWQAANPVVVVGRSAHYLDLGAGEDQVEVVALNMGGVPGVAEIREVLPPGLSAVEVDPPADAVVETPEGGVELVWNVELDARVETDIDQPTLYDMATFRYRVAGSCSGRTLVDAPVADWSDADGLPQRSEGTPLVLACP